MENWHTEDGPCLVSSLFVNFDEKSAVRVCVGDINWFSACEYIAGNAEVRRETNFAGTIDESAEFFGSLVIQKQ